MAVFAKLSRKKRSREDNTEARNNDAAAAAASPIAAVAAAEPPNKLPKSAKSEKSLEDKKRHCSDNNTNSSTANDSTRNKKTGNSGSKTRAESAPDAAKVGAAKESEGTLPVSTDLEFNEPAKWVERMALTSTRSLPTDLDADDDPRREEAFVQQALLSVMRGIDLLDRAEVLWKRPEDYYAEMYKSDVHMNDIRRAMDASKARIEAQSHRRSMKDQKKYGKEVQAEILRQRAKYKRDLQERLNDWKKKRKGNEAIQDLLKNVSNDSDNDDDPRGSGGRGGGGRRKIHSRPRNVRPGGKSSKRPGKNTRHRR